MSSQRSLKDQWASGEAVVGMWCAFADPALLELQARSGYDYVTVDLQHGLNTWGSLPVTLRALRATGATVLVRVQSPDPVQVTRALDLGAHGVVVPMVESAQQAAAMVAACRYPSTNPDVVSGARSYGPVWADHDPVLPLETVSDSAICVLQIETAAGYDAVAQIAATPGVDVAYVGPYDLAISLGKPGATYRDSEEMDAAMQHVVDVALRAGIVAGMHCDGPDMVRAWTERGARMLTAALDTTVVRQAHESLARAAKEAASVTSQA